MLPAYTYEEICKELARTSRWSENVKVAGLLFARPTSPLARDEIIPNLNHFHHRSANYVHFFCGGYGAYWPKDEIEDKESVTKIEDTTWYFSLSKFNQLRKEIEDQTNWQYSGATDLVLLNVTMTPSEGISLDFSSAASFILDQLVTDGVTYSVEMFFEDVFRFGENYRGNNAVEAFMKPPAFNYARLAPTNIGVLKHRMQDAFRRQDYGGVLHTSASVFETMAKHVVQKPTIQNQTLGSFFQLYRKQSALPKNLLDRVESIYNQRNVTPLAGHGGIGTPGITESDAVNIMKVTSDCVRLEYSTQANYVGK